MQYNKSSLDDAVQEVEARETTTIPVDNDHTIEDVQTHNALSKTNDALAKEKTKRRSKPGLVFLLALLMAALGAGAGIMVYKSYFEKSNTATQSSTSTSAPQASSQTSTSPSAESMVNSIKKTLTGTTIPVSVSKEGDTLTADNMSAFGVPHLVPTGYDFYTMPQVMHGVTTVVANQDASFDNITSVRNIFAQHHIQASNFSFAQPESIVSSADYIDATLACTAQETEFSYKQGAHQIHVGCADITSYIDNAKLIQPLYDVYKKTNPKEAVPGILFGRAVVEKSKTAGYQTARVRKSNIYTPTGGSVALFYQTPDKQWHHFADTQDNFVCKEFTTTDMKKAFLGEQCFDNGIESTVRL